MKLKKQQIALVTGATGFVGSHLVRRLVQDGWQVHVLHRATSELPIFSEFADTIKHVYDGSTDSMTRCVAQAKPDIVFHLASLFLSQHETKDVDPLVLGNVLMGTQLLEAMSVNGVTRIVNTGTSWQHYDNKDYNPVCLYAATKQAFEAILEYYVQACGVRAITLKLFDTYGPDDRRPKLFNLLSDAVKTGVTLNMSEGGQFIDPVFIDDVIDAYMVATHRLLNNEVHNNERYAVSSHQPILLRDLVELYSKISKNTISVNWGAKAYRPREVMNPWVHGRLIAKWTPKFTLADGIKKMIESASGVSS